MIALFLLLSVTAKPDGGDSLALANQARALGDDRVAMEYAHQALSQMDQGDKRYENVEVVFAEALDGVGLHQAAAEYALLAVGRRENPELLARALSLLEKLSRSGVIDEEKLVEGVVAFDMATVPDELADFLSYHRGVSNTRRKFDRWADLDFSNVSGGYYGQLVKYVTAMRLVDRKQSEEALKAVDATLEAGKLDGDVQNRFVVMRARLLHQLGKYPEAAEVYRNVRRTSETSPGQIFLERAWSHYLAGDHHTAMGLLYALDAPESQSELLADQYVLRGLIYQRFCHFRAAKEAIRQFHARYDNLIDALHRGVPPESLPAIERAALKVPIAARASRIQTALAAESERTREFEGGVVSRLAKLYDELSARNQVEYQRTKKKAAAKVAEKILEAEEQADLLEYEVGVSIFKPVGQEKELKARTPAEEVPSSGDRTYYRFNGEFWSDELQDMRFLIQDRCVD